MKFSVVPGRIRHFDNISRKMLTSLILIFAFTEQRCYHFCGG